MIEQLTDEERSALDSGMCQGGMKALRIIDAHAADRAGLERELREVERENALDRRYLRDVAESQITQLQRDRESLVARVVLLLREVVRLAEARAAAERDERQARHDYESMMAERNAVQGELEHCEVLAAEWKQTAEGYRLELQVLRTEHEKLNARVERALIPRAP